jgi:hypothetical protein
MAKTKPPETKADINKRQTQPKKPTLPEEENTRFYQLSLNKPQDKLRPLEQHGMPNPFQMRAWAILRSSLGHSIDTISRNTCDLLSYAFSSLEGGACN